MTRRSAPTRSRSRSRRSTSRSATRAGDDGAVLTLERGSPEDPDASIEADPGPLAAVLWHGRDLAAAERAGEVAISGARRAATRFLKRFPLPA